MSARVLESDHGLADLIARARGLRKSVSVGVPPGAPAARYARYVEPTWFREAFRDPLPAVQAAALGALGLPGGNPAALERYAEDTAERMRAAAPVRTGTLVASIKVIR